jgi:hypothetical protein
MLRCDPDMKRFVEFCGVLEFWRFLEFFVHVIWVVYGVAVVRTR